MPVSSPFAATSRGLPGLGQQALPLLLLALLAGLTLLPLTGLPGWPMNHEGNAFFYRTWLYASHLAQGDPFPLWAGIDNRGFGSAQPAFYHKLYYLPAGALYAATGSLKAATLLALWGWLLLGACGIYRLARLLGCARALACCGGAMLLLANYTVTNWLVRGAMAELSAAMLAPWVVAAYLQSLRATRLTPGFAASLALMLLAHATLAYYLFLLLAAVTLGLLATRQISWQLLHLRSLAWPLGLGVLLAGPYLWAMARLRPDYDLARIIPPELQPEQQLLPPGRYLWDAGWHWGADWQGYTVQLDLPVNLLLLGGLAGLLWSRRRRPAGTRDPALLAAALLAGLALLLQTRWAIPFYRHFPGAAYLQFPWRLLAVLTPMLILLALAAVQRAYRPRIALALGGAATLAMLLTCGSFARIQYFTVPDQLRDFHSVRFSLFGEYVPQRFGPTIPSPQASDILRQAMADEGCLVHELPAVPEALARRYAIRCAAAATVALPLFAGPGHVVVGTDSRRCGERPDYPGLCAVRLPAGSRRLEVQLTTFRSLLGG